MYTKCYLVEINSSLESMFEELNDAGFDYTVKHFDDNHFEIYFEEWNTRNIQDIIEIMKWYV